MTKKEKEVTPEEIEEQKKRNDDKEKYSKTNFDIKEYLNDANSTLAAKEKFVDLVEREDLKAHFVEKENIYKMLYNHLIHQSYVTLDVSEFPAIPLKTILAFTRDFDLIPGIVSANQVILMHRTLIRDKKKIDGYMEGINYEEFLNLLTRIINKDFNFFNTLGAHVRDGKIEEGNDLADDKKDDDEEERERKKSEEDKGLNEQEKDAKEFANIDTITALHLNALLFYLGLYFDPKDKNSIEMRLRETMEDHKALPNRMKIQSFFPKFNFRCKRKTE